MILRNIAVIRGLRLLELPRFNSQDLDRVRNRFPHSIAGEPLLVGFEEVFRPAIVKVLVAAFLAAQLGNRLLAAQTFKYEAGLLFADNFRRVALWIPRTALTPVRHRRPPRGYDEPKSFSYAISSVGPVSADEELAGIASPVQ